MITYFNATTPAILCLIKIKRLTISVKILTEILLTGGTIENF